MHTIQVALSVIVFLVVLPHLAPAACVGDCNDDGAVVVNELILGIRIALGQQDPGDCPRFDPDGTGVGIPQLVLGVSHALDGCPVIDATPTPDSAEAPVGPSGGSVAIPGAVVSVPPGAFEEVQMVALSIERDPAAEAQFAEDALLLGADRLPFEYEVSIAGVPPLVDVPLELEIPAGVELTNDLQVQARWYQDGGMEILDEFVQLPSRIDPGRRVLQVEVPPWIFTSERDPAARSEAVLVMAFGGASGGASQRLIGDEQGASATTTACALMLDQPLSDCRPSNSQFRRFRCIPGQPNCRNHGGTDYAVGRGTPVQAMAGGRVTVPPRSTTAGNWVIIDHPGTGCQTRYLHLRDAVMELNGTTIAAGTLIGTSNNTGSSTGDHLHVDVTCGGQRIDPEACMRPCLPSPTATASALRTMTGTATETATQTVTPSATGIPTAMSTVSATPSRTPLPPTASATSTPSAAQSPARTPTQRAPTLTPTVATVNVECGNGCSPDASTCFCNCACPSGHCVAAIRASACQIVCAPFFSPLGCCTGFDSCPRL
jgi:murein DD-endopeptidase MepM/ murein hydrolase activator NlpD